jgi:hypothetical protein
MAKNLYSAYMSAGKSAGQYKASLYETSDWADKFDFIGKQTAWEEEKTSRLVGTIGSALEVVSTIGGGYQDKQKTQARAESLEGKYGDLQKDTRGWKEKGMDWLMGKEQTYTFGEGKTATTLSKTAVEAQGAVAMGESMLSEVSNNSASEVKSPPSLDFAKVELFKDKNFASGLYGQGAAQSPISTTNTNTQNIDSYDRAMTKAQMMEKAGLKLPPTLTGR